MEKIKTKEKRQQSTLHTPCQKDKKTPRYYTVDKRPKYKIHNKTADFSSYNHATTPIGAAVTSNPIENQRHLQWLWLPLPVLFVQQSALHMLFRFHRS